MPGLPKFSNVTADTIKKSVDTYIEKHKTVWNAVATRGGAVTFDNSFAALANADGVAAASVGPLLLHSLVAQDPEVRKQAASCKTTLAKYWSACYARNDVYTQLSKCEVPQDDPQRARLGSKMKQLFVGNGAHLGDAQVVQRLQTLQQETLELKNAIEQEINEDASFIALTKDELEGVSPAFLASLEPVDGASGPLKVGFKRPVVHGVLGYANDPEVRKKVLFASSNRCREANTQRISDLLTSRHEIATLLGFDSHAALGLQSKMAKTPATVEEFLSRMQERVRPGCDKYMAQLLEMKKADRTDATALELWDTLYYSIKLKKSFNVDEEKISEYFPVDHVAKETMSLYEEVLGVKFNRIPDADTWHESVSVYSMSNRDGRELGHLYLDLVSREGKYQHQCVVPIRPAFVDEQGNKQLPACAILGNMGSLNGDTRLLRYFEVVTFLHEFGHCVHCLATESEYSLFSWAWPMVPWPGGVEQDFLEVPSMMFQLWLDHPSIIKRFSNHFQRPGEQLGDDQIASIVDIQYMDAGYRWSRFIAMAKLDLYMHQSAPPLSMAQGKYTGLTIPQAWRLLLKDATGLEALDDTDFTCTWYHPVNGYDACYYSYLWSETMAHDLFSVFEERGILDPDTGRRFFDTVLKPCATEDGNTMVESFLGRPSNEDAFLKHILES